MMRNTSIAEIPVERMTRQIDDGSRHISETTRSLPGKVWTQFTSRFARKPLTAEQADLLATIKFPCC